MSVSPPCVFPVNPAVIRGPTRALQVHNTFGMVRKTPEGKDRAHQGWDFRAKVGTPFLAVADGVVEAVRVQATGYGLQLLVRLDTPVDEVCYVFYAHCKTIDVAQGAVVKQGQVLGLTGKSGNAEGLSDKEDHLHFEARTEKWPGQGLGGRKSPLVLFGGVPW